MTTPTPSQPDEAPQPPAGGDPQNPPRQPKPSVKKMVRIGCGSLFGLLFVLWLIGTIVGPQKKTPAAAAKQAPATTATAQPSDPPQTPSTAAVTPTPTQPTRAASTAAPTSAAPQPTTPPAPPSASPAVAPPAAGLPTPAPTHLAPAANRKTASALLRADNAYYQKEFNDGVAVITARGTGGSFDAWSTWYKKASNDVKPGTDAFTQADAQFDAGDEPPSIGVWQSDNIDLTGDLFRLASDGTGVGGPNDTEARQQVQADVTQFNTDYAKVAQDATDVEAGK
ncbi:hypothetical protein ACFVXG_20755 [Kitasatospora sp. NPDC058162]|uniref:hypothetical protein n=1 Tax=Kitasatospora sp. NPDC058162 TaxID=3346362 RepID=UPI0036DA65AB